MLTIAEILSQELGQKQEYIENVKGCGMVYGVILGVGSITYGSDLRADTIVNLKPNEIYVRLY